MYVTMNFRERIHQALFGEVEHSKSSLETLREIVVVINLLLFILVEDQGVAHPYFDIN